jgi:hypothetical protein
MFNYKWISANSISTSHITIGGNIINKTSTSIVFFTEIYCDLCNRSGRIRTVNSAITHKNGSLPDGWELVKNNRALNEAICDICVRQRDETLTKDVVDG